MAHLGLADLALADRRAAVLIEEDRDRGRIVRCRRAELDAHSVFS
jgi:hypothetical protein